MAWRVAKSLDVLLAQLNAAAPNRSNRSDGSIGDAAHSSRTSDHNPNARGVVCARDFTHDPAGGLDCHQLAAALVASRDPRIKYIIWNRRICSSTVAPWRWRSYSGSNPHTQHLHLSVVGDPRAYDSPASWRLDGLVATAMSEEDDMTPEQAKKLDAIFAAIDPDEGKVRHQVWGHQMGRSGVTHSQVLQGVRNSVERLAGRPVAEVDVDADEVAAAVVDAYGPEFAGAIARATADEVARRMQ